MAEHTIESLEHQIPTGVCRLAGRWRFPLVLTLLALHAGLLAYSATRHSPTHLEPAFLAAGISHWHFGRFDLYRVNPPLPRMIAAIPVLTAGCKTDWRRYRDAPGSRAEFAVGEDFVKANRADSIPLLFYARWACIPFSLIGGWFAYCWASELYGQGAGLITLVLWAFEPNLLAHAELVTPDCACWSFGIVAGYTFWRWLKVPTWTSTGLAGVALGIAELTKFTWIFLFALWPLLWGVWLWLRRLEATGKSSDGNSLRCAAAGAVPPPCHTQEAVRGPAIHKLAVILLLALYILNLGYGFDGFGTRLKDFTFVSSALTGLDESGQFGNRFRNSWLGQVRLPLPRSFVLGLDVQKKDLEDYRRIPFLHGEWKDGGWWYYYAYGLLVKIPCGSWLLFTSLVLCRLFLRTRPARLRDELVLLIPAVSVFALCSAHSEINEHLRYVFPSLTMALIWAGQAVSLGASPRGGIGNSPRRDTTSRAARLAVLSLIAYSTVSSLLAYPHHLAYFNDFVGGPRNGWRHLHGSSLHWGQDLLELARYEAQTGRVFCRYPGNSSTHVILDAVHQYYGLDQRLRRDCAGIVDVADSRSFGQSLMAPEATRIGLTYVAVLDSGPRQSKAFSDVVSLEPVLSPRELSVPRPGPEVGVAESRFVSPPQ